jgi:hypothetical protein
VIVGDTTTPLAHVAWFTRGAAGVTSMHEMSANFTVRAAVVGEACVHPEGSVAGKAKPGCNVAVTVTVWPAVNGPCGVTLYVIPVV